VANSINAWRLNVKLLFSILHWRSINQAHHRMATRARALTTHSVAIARSILGIAHLA